MQPARDPLEPVRLVQTTPPITRLLLGAAGLFALVTPAASFHDVLFQPTLFAMPFWIIALGAALVGGTILTGVVFGDDTVLEVEGAAIRLSRRNPFRRRTALLAPADILDIAIRTVEWDSGPDSYAVEVRLRSGARVGTDAFRRRGDAEALAARLSRALGRG